MEFPLQSNGNWLSTSLNVNVTNGPLEHGPKVHSDKQYYTNVKSQTHSLISFQELCWSGGRQAFRIR